MLCEVVNGKAGDQAYIVDDSGVNGVFVAVLDVRAFFSIVPRRVGGHELSFTLQSHIVSLKDEFWYDSEFRLIARGSLEGVVVHFVSMVEVLYDLFIGFMNRSRQWC